MIKFYTLLIIVLISSTSCSSFVNSIHNQISASEKSKVRRPRSRNSRNPYKITNRYGQALNTHNTKNHVPEHIRRNYHSKAKDLVDNDKSNSLWIDQENGLLTVYSKSQKKPGDIVIIEVMKDLNEKIQDELERVFPNRTKKAKKGATPPAPAPKAAGNADDNKVFDKISTLVVEAINKDFLLLRGKKELLHHNRKRHIEVQALVPAEAIDDQNAITSLKTVEVNIMVRRF